MLELVQTYNATFHRPASASVLADALGKGRSTIRDHLEALHRKGWLLTKGSSAVPRPPAK